MPGPVQGDPPPMTRATTTLTLGSLGLALAALACTDAELRRPVPEVVESVYDNKLSVSGKFCTTDPYDVVFPLKIMFVIDTSQSMNVSDPVSTTEMDPLKQTGRVRAVSDVINLFIDLQNPKPAKRCHPGTSGCAKGSTRCPTCADPKNPSAQSMCIGPDCCTQSVAYCKGVTLCSSYTTPPGSCYRLCDSTKAGCGKGEKNCPDCPTSGECQGGICGQHRDPGVEFALMRFGSAKQVLTKNKKGADGFTNDLKELLTALPQLSNGGSVTDYEGALSMVYKVIDSDLKDLTSSNAAAVNRTKYVVVFLSDGKPYPEINDEDDWDHYDCSVIANLLDVSVDLGNCDNNSALSTMMQNITEYNLPSRALRRVQEIMTLKVFYGAGDLTFHTAYLAGAEPAAVADQSRYLLEQMAQVGEGTFTNFPNGESINFLGSSKNKAKIGFTSLRRVFEMKNFIATNVNARPRAGRLYTDSDGDGLDDGVEQDVGTSPYEQDTDGDGFSDTLEHFYRASGWDALDPSDADCPLFKDKDGDGKPDDTDGDELRDCEERFMGTASNEFDTDLDGIPDSIESRFQTNPVLADTENDLDFDGMPNGDEIRLHTDPNSDDAAHRSRVNYRYNIGKTGTGVETVGLTCKVDTDCPRQQRCKESYCRCSADADCVSAKACTLDADCTIQEEKCVSGKCGGDWTCRPAFKELQQSDKVCSALRYITCYDFDVDNIALVSPKADPQSDREDGWNSIYLYFAEAPFDNPTKYGSYQKACVQAWYKDTDGSKQPSDGAVVLPRTAWTAPETFAKTYKTANTKAGGEACGVTAANARVYCNPNDECINVQTNRCQVSSCVCPDGQVGLCSKK